MSENKVRKNVYISGRVQGVGFRASTRRKAKQVGVKGWVRNLYDGRVEAVFAGEKEKVQKLINYVNKGPSFARVENVEVIDREYKGEFNNFTVKR